MRRLFNGFLPDRSSSTNSKPTNSTLPIGSAGNIKFDNAPVMIHNSCIRLSDTIQDILNNTGELSGDNITGFERLLTIITKDVRLETATDILRSNGEGCFTILISNMNHPLFIETCTKNSLPTTLMNVLRLLRMYEIKRCKTDVRSEKGSTVDACHRVCQVFQFLFNDPCTTEQIRQALVKLLTFPLSVLPAHALHLQQQSVRIITSMCRTGFTSQQVWFLHDVQAVTHMIRHLNELAQMKNESRDQLLRGEAAEKSGMWLNGCTCIVELVSSSTNVSSVLLNDLEAAGGVQLFINMLKYSAPDRFMKLLNIITRLVFDPMKTEQEHIPSPIVGLVIIDLIRWLYDLQNDISETDNVERLLATISTISTRKRFIESRIYMIQAFCYSLLTIYSNDQLTCNVLEEGYHFLPLLLLVIPTVSSDAVTAVLTVLSYVCQCAENIATFPLIAFCASFTAIINEALSRKLTHEYRLKSMEQIELLLNAFDTIVRSNTKYCTMLLGCGFLQYIVCQPLEELYKNCKNDEYIIEDIELNLYEKLLTMLLLVNSKSPFVADKLMVSGVPQLLQQLLMKPSVTSEFTKVLLTLSEDLARSNTSHLEESMKLILDTLVQIGAGQFEKKRRILDSLSKIVAESHEASTICISLDAFDRILTTIEEMKDLFLTTNSATADSSSSASSNCSNDHQMLLRCLESGMRLLALMFCLSTTQVNEAVDNLTAMRFQKHYLRLATALIASGIYNTPFWSKCNDYLFGLLNGFTESTAILNAKITETMIVLMQQIPDESAVDIANRLLFFVNINPSNQKILSEAGVVSQLVLAFHRELLVDSNSLVAKVLELIKILTYSYLTIEGFITIFMYIVRPVVQNKEANYNSLKMPWICRDQSMAHTSWDAIQYVVDLAARTAEKDDSVPHLVLGTKSSANNAPTCLAITLNETTKPFPHSAFSFACWFKIGLEMNCATNNDWVAPLKGIIPILSICSPANDCFFEGQLDVDNSLIRIAVIRNGNGLSTIRFKLVHTLKTNDWNSIVINFKKSKRFTGVNKSTVSVYINGIQAIPETTDTLDVPYTSSSANFYVGKLFIKSLSSFSLYDISQGDDKLMSNLTSAESWKLGPCSLYDDILSAAQIATVFMKGPKYIGSYQAESSLMDNLPTLSTLLLQRCNSGGDTADAIMDLLGLRGLELVVDPYIEGMSLESAAKFEFPMLPQSVFLYTCNSVADNVAEGADSYTLVGIPPLQRSNTLQIDTDAVLKQQKQLMLLNRSTLDSITPIAVVENGFSDYCSSSFADCITCAGGPALLLPLLQMASTSEQILTTISLVRSTIYLHASNVLYMKTIGYKLMAFILSLKGSDLITPDVLEAMKTLACSRWKNSDGMSPSTDGLLLVDTCAFYYLYLNHQFWSPLRYDLALASLTGLFQLSNDEKYSALNSTRLSLLGVSRWTLMLVLFGIKKCTDQPKESKSEKVLELINPSSTQENGSQSSMYDSRHDVSIENDSYAWKMVTPSYAAMADFRDPHEPAIHLATEIVQKVITAKLRQSDIELIARIISYSFIPLYNATCINAAILDAEEVIIDVDAEKEYPFCDFESQEKEASSANHNRMKPMEVFRIQLLRLLTTLYSIHTVEPHFKKNRNRPETSTRKSAVGDSEGLIIFRSTLTPEWFLCVLEKPNDVATFSAILRLLGLMIQRDIKFFKDFCAEDGMKILCRIIITNAQPLPVVLPLLALLFRIPMQMLSHPSQIRSVAKFVQLLELEECAGPDLIDPVAGEQTIPILATTLECLANSVRLVNSAVGPEKVAAKRVVDIVFGILQYGIIKSVSFKQLMQQKTPIELLSYAVLVCSTAYNDFGSQIYTTTNEAVDLSSSIQEDYISASGEFSPKSSDATDSLEKQRMDRSNSGQSVSSNSATSPGRTNVRTIAIVDHHNADRLEVKMLSEDAERLLHFVSLIMCQSTTEFMNPSVLSFFFVSYPKSFLASYEFGYQKLILEQFHKVLVQLTKKTMDTGSLHSICDMITCLLPLSRTEVLYESIQFDIFKALLDLYTRSAGSALTTLKQAKELGNTTRFFAIACILMWSSPTRSDSKNFRLSVLCAIKININYLLNSHLEDALECPSSSIHGSGRFLTNRVEYDHAATTNGTAEAFHGKILVL